MRRILTGLALAALIALVPTLARADNQDKANQIAQKLRDSGQLSNYKIGVKYQSGTAWLRGRVTSEDQVGKALKLTSQMPGVSHVVNKLSVASASGQVTNPLRGTAAKKTQKAGLAKRLERIVARDQDVSRVERVPTSFGAGRVQKTSAEEWRNAMPSRMALPQRARMMKPTYVSRNQPVRGPMAPSGNPMPMYTAAASHAGVAPARYDQPRLPNYAWPSYAAYPNYAAVTYPKQYSPTAWPYIGPFYPYPQVPLGWRKVTLEWDDGWWFLDFKDQPASCWRR